ncbi:MAG: hypothetical protein JSS66_03540 [Armatimonadetes bacterium]|nr:hypothetical protein [Armatimonadota bacterium]
MSPPKWAKSENPMGKPDRLELTEDEAYALLSLCMTSDLQLDAQSEVALRKLAEFCKSHKRAESNHSRPAIGGLCEAG